MTCIEAIRNIEGKGIWVMDKWLIVFYVLLACGITLSLLGAQASVNEVTQQQDQLDIMKIKIEELKIEQQTVNYLLDLVEEYQNLLLKSQNEIDRLKDILDSIGIDVFEITAYAPLDPNAVDGWDYEGNPNVTANGSKTTIGHTIAADTSILPFGTKVWVEGFGWREVQDRGGLIKGKKIDVAVSSLDEAYKFGRQEKVIVYEK